MSNKKQSIRPHILILGGSEMAYLLAQRLEPLSLRLTTSLAGRTQHPRLPRGAVRQGGFGGVNGLVQFLQEAKIALILDATHPFARNIKANAVAAAIATRIPVWQLSRPAWQSMPDDRWLMVKDEVEAARVLPHNFEKGSKKTLNVFLALGRQHLGAFACRPDIHFTARMLERLDDGQKFTHLKIILGKPGSESQERELFQKHKIDFLVCRNSGAKASYGKIIAARNLSIPVVMITHPEGEAVDKEFENIRIFKTLDALYAELCSWLTCVNF